MKVGYARVSTTDQNPDLQIDVLESEGCTKIFKDYASGAKSDREGLEQALEFMREEIHLWSGALIDLVDH